MFKKVCYTSTYGPDEPDENPRYPPSTMDEKMRNKLIQV